MPALPRALKQVPAVPVEVREERLAEDDTHVEGPGEVEYLLHVGDELGVERHERHQEKSSQRRGDRVAHGQQPHELPRQTVVLFVLEDHAQDFGDQYKDRHPQHERREHQMRLGQAPHEHATADHREVPILGDLERAWEQVDQEVDDGEDERDLQNPATHAGQSFRPAPGVSHEHLASGRGRH